MHKFFKMIAEEFEDAESFGEFILYMYYKALPYDWRPKNIWYKIKCFAWHRHTTIKPRQLDHTWCDKTELVPHMMFEMLSEFLEKECSPGHIDWEGSNHRIQYGGHSRNVNDVMWHLYHWWYKVYLIKCENKYDQWHEYRESNTIKSNKFDAIWKTEWISDEHERHADILWKRARKKDAALSQELNENLKYIVDLIPYLWT